MTYLLIFDLKGNNSGRRRVNRYLARVARRVQHSVWEFRDLRSLRAGVGLVQKAGGKSMAFMKSDRILFNKSEIKRMLRDLS
jgi:CRISPR/Cas system-associated endoribonuclease Cas2